MAPRKKAAPGAGRGRKPAAGAGAGAAGAQTELEGAGVAAYKYPTKRKNIPPAGIASHGTVNEAPKVRYEYNPHLPPVLRSSDTPGQADRLPALLEKARHAPLTKDEADLLAAALRKHEPWLEWAGKREKPWFEVEPVALHIHERVSTQAILRVLAREEAQRDLFADPQQEYAQAVQFYQHDVAWANRMILGDSLQVMASLARREDLAGKVQMIYFDPPYGIKFSSNFQPQLGQRDVKDREQDLTREPEMVRAYRDTWTLGIHSYLAYLRDRLTMARELLTDSGSIFVQISDENLHRVRLLMDEVFGPLNFVASINFRTMMPLGSDKIESVYDYIVWFAKDKESMKYRNLTVPKSVGGDSEFVFADNEGGYDRLTATETKSIEDTLKSRRVFKRSDLYSSGYTPSCTFPFSFHGAPVEPRGKSWRTNKEGVERLIRAERLFRLGDKVYFKLYHNDYTQTSLQNSWADTIAFSGKTYVVETVTTVVERCMLMTTDPGDLVLDPTCGSGTTAFVAEQWGRRWIAIDTSRVALALAKQRILTSRFPFYQLRKLSAEDLDRNPKGTWIKNGEPQPKTLLCKSVPHITLKSIARNTSLDPIFARHAPILTAALAALNAAIKKTVTDSVREKLVAKLDTKARAEGARAVTDADARRWLLPGTKPAMITEKKAAKLREKIPSQAEWREWEVPFDTDPDWPKALQEALTAYRAAWRAKMDEVNACISANAEMEELVDKPEIEPGVVRVSGPFTVEGVIALEDGHDTPIGGAPETLDGFEGEGNGTAAVVNAEAHLDKIIRLLKATGVDFPGNKNMTFNRLEPVTGASLIHAEGEWVNGDKRDRRVAVSVGPEVGNITSYQVEDVIRDANRKGYDDVVFAAFGFDAAAQDAITSASHPKLRLHMALIRPDVAMGDLLKTQPGSQLFTVFTAPRVAGPIRQPDGEYVVEVEGMDVYDPVTNTLHPTDKDRIAAWFLDSDYDGRTFCICQAFFPDKTKWAKLAKALGDKGVVDEDKFTALSGLVSLPFPRPARLGANDTWRVAVKVIDPRGNEGLRVLTLNADGEPVYA